MVTEERKKKRILYVDILNIISMFAVVMLHHNGIVHQYSDSRAWKTSLIVETLFYWAVPVFLMISGAMLMEYRKKYDTKTFFKKRFSKVLIPFVFWSCIMAIWKVKTGQISLEHNSIKDYINIVLNCEAIYYFGYVILGLYLTMPLLSCLSEEKYKKTLWYTVIIFFVFNAILPLFSEYFDINYNKSLSLQVGGYVIFILLGYLLSKEEIVKKYRIIVYLLGAVSFILRYFVTFYLSTRDGHINKVLFGYSQFHSILLACAVFVFIRNIQWDNFIKKEIIMNWFGKIASCSFGIYLTHKIVMYYEQDLLNINIYSWQWRTIGAICTYLISLGIILILKKIPIIKRIVA